MNPFIGQVILFAGNFAPRGWALCEGQLLAIASHDALFSILGTTYGGDGRTTFGLPDLRGRVPVSPGTGPGLPNYRLGEKTGNATTTLTAANLPPAPVSIPASADDASTDEPSGHACATTSENAYGNPSTGESMSAGKIMGSNSPFSNQPPSLAINYIIALQGTYPSRN